MRRRESRNARSTSVVPAQSFALQNTSHTPRSSCALPPEMKKGKEGAADRVCELLGRPFSPPAGLSAGLKTKFHTSIEISSSGVIIVQTVQAGAQPAEATSASESPRKGFLLRTRSAVPASTSARKPQLESPPPCGASMKPEQWTVASSRVAAGAAWQ